MQVIPAAITDIQESRETALVLRTRTTDAVVTAPVLDRPVSSLAEHIQQTMNVYYTVQSNLMKNNNVPKCFLEQFKREKQTFRTECERMREMLQTSYRHAADYASSSQRAPSDRSVSAKRCLLSAKGVLCDLQRILRVYATIVTDFEEQKQVLAGYLRAGATTDKRQSLLSEHESNDVLSLLYTALEGIQSSLRDIHGFWEHHIGFLTRLVNQKSSLPEQAEEASATFELWTKYQAELLQSSSSICESADALSVDPLAVVSGYEVH